MTYDWDEFKRSILIDKSLEKSKRVRRFIKDRNFFPKKIQTQEKIIPIQQLVRDIFIDDSRSVNRGILDRLRRGSYPIDISVDLHGYTIEEAYKVFYQAFLCGIKNNLRLILVITGKGDSSGYSIRSQLLKWVNIPEVSSYIIYISEAHNKHGGDGAFYLFLRTRRF